MAVSMVKKAIHPLGLQSQDRAIKSLGKKGCGVLFNTVISGDSIQIKVKEHIYCSHGGKAM